MRRFPVFRSLLLPILAAGSLRGAGADAAAVSGVAVNDSTGKPIHTALVTLSTTGDRPIDAMMYTDARGAFWFNGVPPGQYYLHADDDGYEHVWFGAPTPDRAPAVLTLGAGQVRQGIELRLRPLASLSGLVVDQEGDPLQYARVQLLASTWARGKKAWAPNNAATSNERGEFRIHGIAPGRFVLMASRPGRQPAQTRSEVSLGEPVPESILGRAYYPGAIRIADAQPIEVKPGADMTDITLRLATTAPASVNCLVELPEGVSAGTGVVAEFRPRDELAGMFGMGQSNYTHGEKLSMSGLEPGHYQVVTVIPGNNEYRGVDEIDLQPGPQDAVLHLTRGVRLAGRLDVQGPGTGDITQYKIDLISGETPPPAPNRLSASVQADGSFVFSAVLSGVWDIGVQPIPKGGYAKSMKLGDQDVLTEDMVIAPGVRAPLNIVVSSRGGIVKGTVKRPPASLAAELTGRPRPLVLLAPTGRFSHVLSFFMLRAAEEDGKYEIQSITPGQYKAFAFERFDRNSIQDADFMARIDPLGKAVEVREGEPVVLDLDMLPGAPGGSER